MLSSVSAAEKFKLIDGSGAVVIDNYLDQTFLREVEKDAHLIRIAEPSRLEVAKFGSSNALSAALRGDRTCWVTVDLCKELKLDAMKALVQRLIKGVKDLVAELDLLPDYSMQFAVYPGNGAGYVKHLDFDIKRHAAGVSVVAPAQDETVVGRKLTVILYLNEHWEGGQLRVHQSDGGVINIDPSLGRIVLFRSDKVEHEVLPSWRDRMALTFWISGRYRIGYTSNSIDGGKPCGPVTVGAAQTPLRIPHSLSAPSGLPQPHWDSRRIFVSVASYCDSECGKTVRELYRTAAVPSRVSVGVVWQGKTTGHWDWEHIGVEGGASSCSAGASSSGSDATPSSGVHFACHRSGSPGGPLTAEAAAALRMNVRVVAMSASQANGPCWARHIAGALWRGEDYLLQVDSHMRFRIDWDRYLIWQLESTREQQRQQQKCQQQDQRWQQQDREVPVKPILTTYPLGYRLPDLLPDDIRPTLLVPSHFDPRGMLRQRGRAFWLAGPPATACAEEGTTDGTCEIRTATRAIPSPMWASGFSFSDSSVLHEVPYDPNLPYLFFGEEVSMAARLFTHGYDFFSPPEAVVYHLWTRDHRPSFLADAHAQALAATSVQHQSTPITPRTEAVDCVDCSAHVSALRDQSERRIRVLLGVEAEKPHHVDAASGDGAVADPAMGWTGAPSRATTRFGLGSCRTLRQFEESIGVSFAAQKIVPQSYSAVVFASDEMGELLAHLFEPSASTSSSSSSNSMSDTDSGSMSNSKHISEIPSDACRPVGVGAPGSNNAILALNLVKQYLS